MVFQDHHCDFAAFLLIVVSTTLEIKKVRFREAEGESPAAEWSMSVCSQYSRSLQENPVNVI